MSEVKNKPIYAHFFSQAKKIINGRVVKDVAINSEYDGTQIYVDKRVNNKISHFVLKPYKRKTHKRKTHKHKTHKRKTYKRH